MAPVTRQAALDAIDMPARMGRLLFEAQLEASAAGYPNEFIEGMEVRKVSDTRWELVNTWTGVNYHTGEADVPLALFWEEGTKDHLVLPVYAKALSWTERFGDHTVKRHYSRGHVVRGIGGARPMGRAYSRAVAELGDFVASGLAGAIARA